MKLTKFLACLAIAVGSFASTAYAGVVYDESVDGDAPSAGGAGVVGANVGVLSVGDNMILGSAGPALYDDYIFTIPEDTLLEGISLNLGSGSGTFGADLYTAHVNPGTLVSADTILYHYDVIGPGHFIFFAEAMPLGSGVYRIDNTQSGGGLSTWNYAWTLTLRATSISEPATLALLGFGLAGLGFVRRHKQDYQPV